MAKDETRARQGLPRHPGGESPGAAGESPVATGNPAVAASTSESDLMQAPIVSARRAGLTASPPVSRVESVPESAPKPSQRFTFPKWAGKSLVAAGGVVVAGVAIVLFSRWILSTQWGADFLAEYPGEYALPKSAPVGFPAWLGWQHFFSVFFMVLIVRSGLRVRTEKRPTTFWSRRGNPQRKISLNLWFHQSIDILWLANGVIFIVLLFITGQWLRIVPTSVEVFPNALSAALQYASLDWPTENGWVNYNALQQLAYFATVFLASPLAVITGVRMSGLWPKNAKVLNKLYPVEWARAIHFPTMIYFLAFTFVHVLLVFATGALRNLNHMYAMNGSADPNEYQNDWTGFWIFFASLAIIAGAWIAARPIVLASIARVFGRVSAR
jgi:thiosulfate reductase cytochrome b subunit